MGIKTIEWEKGMIKLIDQTKLPNKLEYIYIKDIVDLRRSIRMMKTRGAPALGAAAGLGIYLGVKDSRVNDFKQFKSELDKVIDYLAAARPTARNLFWGLERVRQAVLDNKEKSVRTIKKIIFTEANKIIKEDMSACRKISYYGAKLIKKNDTILTICNAGILATIDYGTALGVIYHCKAEGKSNKVYACETRPMLQGARLTTWELSRQGIDVTLICDNMAATLMQQGKIDRVITGADRIASNGDTANKIGTYNLAVLCKFHKIPFYIAAPVSTFDLKINSGREIPIEERGSLEMTKLFFKNPIAGRNVKVYNPAFDVTPRRLISAIITEKGIIRPDYKNNIRKIIGK
ncbi:MAG: S-methyl-5-thioribose-1-phosphate isomerase [Candidatus Omnitrophota bacterium]